MINPALDEVHIEGVEIWGGKVAWTWTSVISVISVVRVSDSVRKLVDEKDWLTFEWIDPAPQRSREEIDADLLELMIRYPWPTSPSKSWDADRCTLIDELEALEAK